MAQKLYVKPPKQTIGVLLVMAFVVGLFFLGGLTFYWNLFDDIQRGSEFWPVSGFFLIWCVATAGMFIHFIKLYVVMKTGKVEIGEIGESTKEFKSNIEVEEVSNSSERSNSDFASRLRNLDSLKKDGLISDDEYNSKHKEIMDEKW